MGDENEPPDKILYGCHKKGEQKECSAYVCVVCGIAFHRSCYERAKKGTWLKGSLIICNQHLEADITTKITEKDIQKLTVENAKTLLIEMSQKTWYYEYLKEQNKLLKEHNDTLKDKNKLLEEKNEILEKKTHTPLFSNVVSNQHTSNENTEKVPTLIIKPNTQQNAEDTIKDINKSIKSLRIGVNKTTKLKDGTIRMRCRKKDENTVFTKKLNEIFENKYTCQQEELWKPVIKIVEINEEYTNEELKNMIIQQNFSADIEERDIQITFQKHIQKKKYVHRVHAS